MIVLLDTLLSGALQLQRLLFSVGLLVTKFLRSFERHDYIIFPIALLIRNTPFSDGCVELLGNQSAGQ